MTISHSVIFAATAAVPSPIHRFIRRVFAETASSQCLQSVHSTNLQVLVHNSPPYDLSYRLQFVNSLFPILCRKCLFCESDSRRNLIVMIHNVLSFRFPSQPSFTSHERHHKIPTKNELCPSLGHLTAEKSFSFMELRRLTGHR